MDLWDIYVCMYVCMYKTFLKGSRTDSRASFINWNRDLGHIVGSVYIYIEREREIYIYIYIYIYICMDYQRTVFLILGVSVRKGELRPTVVKRFLVKVWSLNP